eukprot:gene57392-78630_t
MLCGRAESCLAKRLSGGELVSPPIGQATPFRALEHRRSALAVVHGARVVAKVKLGAVAVKVRFAHVVIGTDDTALEDLGNLMAPAIATIVRNADKREMALALKGAPPEMRQLFFGGMTERAAKLLKEDMAGMGPVRARECEEAQSANR